MKPLNPNKKMTLKKVTINHLSDHTLDNVKGGWTLPACESFPPPGICQAQFTDFCFTDIDCIETQICIITKK